MKKYQVIKKDQLMWCKVDTKNGAFGITKKEHEGTLASTNMALANIDTEKYLPEFIEKLFRISSFSGRITHLSSGSTNRKYLTPKQLFELVEVPKLTIAEQVRFIEKLNNYEESGFRESINFQQSHLALLRQQILQDAISGKLTADWRAENPDTEPASKLLEQIKAEKEKLIAEKKIKKEKPLSKIVESEMQFELPECWEWCRLGDICTKVTDGFHHTPPKKKEGEIYISATHIKDEGIKWDECLFIPEKEHRELFKKAFPQKGEILITNRGAGCGTPAIIDIDEEFSFQNAALIGFNQQIISNKLVYYFILKSRAEIMAKFVNGGLQPMLSNVILRTIPFPLPPRAEQRAIVAKVERLMGYVSQLEGKVALNANSAETLMQAFLGEVFRK